MLLACRSGLVRVAKAISRRSGEPSHPGCLVLTMEHPHQKKQPRQRHPQASGGPNAQHHHHHRSHHHHRYSSNHDHSYHHPPHLQPPMPPQYHGQQPDFPQPTPPLAFPPVRSPSFQGPMSAPPPSSGDFHHSRLDSAVKERQDALSSNWSQHHSHSSLPLPPQDHSFGPQHHHKQLPWGAPPPDDHWPVPPPPHHFSGGPQQHFPLMPPGSGAPPDPGVMQKDGSHRGRPFGAVQVNFKPMHVFQQQSRGFSSGGQGSSRGNWQGEQGSRSNYSLQNGRMGVSHRDQSAMERHHEGKSYKKFKTQTPSHRVDQGSGRSPRNRAPLRPMVEVSKSLKLRHTTMVSVLSYNLLAQSLLEKNMELYDRQYPQYLDWDFRKAGLLRELQLSSSDILCLQEVQQDHYHHWFLPELSKLGYSGVYVQRTGSHQDGCAMFYKHSKLKLVDWLGLKYRRNVKVLNRDNVALLAKMELVQGDGIETSFCVANTHLLFNPKAGEVKLAQIAYLFAELHKMASNSGSMDPVPVLLCGDLNSTPHSPLVNFVTTANLDYADLSAVVIAGFHDNSKKKRVIPKPLLPSDMAIGTDCMYMAGGMQGRESNNDERTKPSISEGSGSAVQPPGTSRTKGQPDLEFKDAQVSGDHPQQELSKDLQECRRATRSARGRRVATPSSRFNGVLDLPGVNSLLQTNLSPAALPVKRTRDHLSAEDMKSSKSTSSGASSVDDMAMEVRGRLEPEENTNSRLDCQSQSSSMTEESTGDRQQNSESKKPPAALVMMTLNNSFTTSPPAATQNGHPKNMTANGSNSNPGCLTHPFKLVPAYPHPSQYRPSTVTTYHQVAFETVDYIFFTPMTYRQTSSGKKLLCGFHLIQRQVLPSTHTLLDLGPQPHQHLCSDHLLLKTTFQFTG